jgi:hypothetical protein
VRCGRKEETICVQLIRAAEQPAIGISGTEKLSRPILFAGNTCLILLAGKKIFNRHLRVKY